MTPCHLAVLEIVSAWLMLYPIGSAALAQNGSPWQGGLDVDQIFPVQPDAHDDRDRMHGPLRGSPDHVKSARRERDGDTGMHTYTCQVVGSSYSDGFFSLKAFNGKLYAGQFGYGHASQSMLFSYPPWELTRPGLTGIGESVCALEVFADHLYANTEHSGDIFRSADGSHWELVHDEPAGCIGCGLELFRGLLYAVSYNYQEHAHGKVLSTSDGWNWSTVYDSGGTPLYIREVTSCAGSLYAFAVNESTRQGYLLVSTDGTSWESVISPTRFMRGCAWRGVLYAGSADRTSNGVSGIWRIDGRNTTLVHQVPQHYVMEFSSWDDALWATTSNGWKEDHGPASLLMSRDGTSWEQVFQFDETAAWCNTVFAGNLYVGTWQFGKGGKVYKVMVE